MESKALDTLQTFLGRRGLDTTVTRVVTEDIERVNLFTIGGLLIVFSQKDKGLLDRDIRNYVAFASANGYTNGIIIVGLAKPSDNVLKAIKSHAKDRVQFFWIWHLQSDWTQHRYYLPHRVLNEEERKAVLTAYKLKTSLQLPAIDSQDYPARVVGAIPGDILEIQRKTEAGPTRYYRVCVEDTNVA